MLNLRVIWFGHTLAERSDGSVLMTIRTEHGELKIDIPAYAWQEHLFAIEQLRDGPDRVQGKRAREIARWKQQREGAA